MQPPVNIIGCKAVLKACCINENTAGHGHLSGIDRYRRPGLTDVLMCAADVLPPVKVRIGEQSIAVLRTSDKLAEICYVVRVDPEGRSDVKTRQQSQCRFLPLPWDPCRDRARQHKEQRQRRQHVAKTRMALAEKTVSPNNRGQRQ